MQQEFKLGQLEALLFAAGEPLGVPQLAELLGYKAKLRRLAKREAAAAEKEAAEKETAEAAAAVNAI